jgi:hypothetical protein
VVAPRLLENQRSKRQKTDRLDARGLLGDLEDYLRGNRDAIEHHGYGGTFDRAVKAFGKAHIEVRSAVGFVERRMRFKGTRR